MKTLLSTALLLTAFAASAHEVDMKAAAGVEITDVAVMESNEGEGRTAFVKRVAERLEAFTTETGHEACGWVAVGGKSAFSVRIVTMGSQIACGAPKAMVAEGYVATNDTIHSHPQARNLLLTKLDLTLTNVKVANRRFTAEPCKFSDADYSNSGFLVTCGKVFYQNGRGTEKEL